MRFHSALLLCSLLSLAGSALKADVVSFQGTSSGHYEFVGIPLGQAVGSLAYNQGPGFIGATDTSGTLQLPNLGTFTLGRVSELAVYGADLLNFRLFINFALPTGVQGAPATFLAELQGQARFQLFGDTPERVEVEFGTNSYDFIFENAAGKGSFTLQVDDLTVANGNAIVEYAVPRALTGRILNATLTAAPTPTPEPASLALVGSAFTAMVVVVRRRQRQNLQ